MLWGAGDATVERTWMWLASHNLTISTSVPDLNHTD